MELHAYLEGSGDPLVILHGLFGSGDNWRSHARTFAEHFEVHVLDLRNHGRSTHQTSMTYDEMASDVGWYISSEGIGPAHVLGHSLGGKVAMWLALQHPALVEKLIVVDIAPRDHPAAHRDILNALCGLNLLQLSSRSDADKRITQAVPSRKVRQFLLKNLRHKRSGGYRWKMNLPVIEASYDQLRGWPGSTSQRSDKEALFIAGTRSDYITADDSDRIIEIFPRARFVDIDAGHWLHSEAPDEFMQACLSFLLESDRAF